MATILRYFISGANADWLDLGTPGSEFTLVGQQFIATGSATVNTVRAALGVDLDARNLLAGEDVIVFNYRWDQYTKDISSVSGAIVFSYLDSASGLTEKVTVLNGATTLGRDRLIFADGAVLTQNAKVALATSLTAALSTVTGFSAAAGSTTSTFVTPTPAGNTYRAFASTTNTTGQGALFAMAEAGQTLVATGSSQVDKVYVKAGAVVDARNLLAGEDAIYLTGKWADYAKSLTAVSGAIQFTRTINGMNEVVTVLNGATTLGRDKLVFADGAVLSQNARTALTTSMSTALTAVVGYDGSTVTPFVPPNTAPDTVAPTFISAATTADGTKVVLNYAEGLNANTAPASAFAVKVNNVNVNVLAAAVNGGTIELSLASPVQPGQTVTVGYSAPTSNTAPTNLAVQDVAGNDAVSLPTTTTVSNKVAPIVTAVTDATTASVTKDPITFTVTFSAALAADPTTANFTASSGDVTSVTKQSGNSYNVVVTPTVGLASGTVGLSLVGGSLKDAAGNAVLNASLSSMDTQAIDTLAPTAPSISTPSAATNSTSATIAGTAEANSTVSIFDGTTLLGTAMANGSGAFSYSATGLSQAAHSITAKATDAAGNVSAASTAMTLTVDTTPADTTPPVFTSAATSVDGTKIVMTYTEALSATTAAAGAFDVTVAGSMRVVSAVAVAGSTVELTLVSAVNTGEVVSVVYKAPTADALPSNAAVQDVVGNDAVALSSQPVVNNSLSTTVTDGGTYAANSGVNIYVIDAAVTLSATINGFAAGDVLRIVHGTEVQGINVSDPHYGDNTTTVVAGNAVITLTGLSTDVFLPTQTAFTDQFGVGAVQFGNVVL